MIKIKDENLGIILSGASTREASCQLLEGAENGKIHEGMLVLINTANNRKILSRIAQIRPYNAFYTKDDPWSEARRKGLEIPSNIARQFEICDLDLLIELPKSEVKYPPKPGDHIVRIDPTQHERDIFGVTRGDAGYSWYGTLSGYQGAPIPLDVEKIPMHMAVFGTTGSGKSFDTGCLIEKFMGIKAKEDSCVSFPMIIIDANGDYLNYADYFESKSSILDIDPQLRPVVWIKRFIFPHIALYNPKLGDKPIIGIDLDKLSSRELAETIILYYKGTLEGSELQLSAIVSLLEHMIDEKGYESMHQLFEDDESYDDLKSELAKFDTNRIAAPSKPAVIRAFEKFREIENNYQLLSAKKTSLLTDEKFIDDITAQGGTAIIDFSEDGATGVEIQAKQLVMTYLATLLFNKFSNYKIREKSRYLIFLIEEAQNFIPDKSYPVGSSLAKNKLSLIATQGRKFGLSLCIVTQRPSFIDKIVLSMCNTFYIHRISPDDVSYVRSVTGGLPESIGRRLTRLNQGELIVTGQMNRVPFPLLIKIPFKERIVEHTQGTTEVVNTLSKLRG